MFLKHIGMTYVKATRLLDLEQATLTNHGIAGDRAFILLDEKGKPLAPGHHRHFLPLRFDLDTGQSILKMIYPDGRVVEEACITSDEISELDYMGMRTVLVRRVLGDWNRRLQELSGKSVTLVRPVAPGGGIDVLPITLVTTASLRDLETRMGAEVDYRRFRANLIIECDEPYAEDGWNGRLLHVGAAVLKVRGAVPRCVVTQLDPDSGANNARTVAVLQGFRDRVHLPDGLMPEYATPGFASYAEVALPGEIFAGDSVTCE